ncbi:DUF4190 domain-containing protein [Cerasicoccus maritimus]|uniref:DUF4190 domain-containing protein n=1 Tax=Cerasicoccus maritimus TaxID=490089 RepID=UPI003CCE4E46
MEPPSKTNAPLISFICGVCGLFGGLGFILCWPAIIFGHVGLKKLSIMEKRSGRWMAIWGLILGYFYLALLFFVLGWIAWEDAHGRNPWR